MIHKASAVRDVTMEHINTAFISKSTHIRNTFEVFTEFEFPFISVWESDSTCILQGQKAENSHTFLFSSLASENY